MKPVDEQVATRGGVRDQQLNHLVELALANNHDLRVPLDRGLGHTLRDDIRSLPNGIEASYTRQRLSKAVAPTSDRDITQYEAGLMQPGSWISSGVRRSSRPVRPRWAAEAS
jgi:outer membrane protein TolC